MDSASAGVTTGYSMGRVEARASTSSAAARAAPKPAHTSQSGRQASTAFISMKVAKASFSQMPFHQRMVTRSPNQRWASSWLRTDATLSSSRWSADSGSTSRSTSRNVMQPRFSMAPKAKSGSATRSTLPPGTSMPYQSANHRREWAATSRANAVWSPRPGGWMIRTGTPSTSTGSVASMGPTTNATR